MVVIAIVGMVASMALPSVTGAMMRARRAEQRIVRRGINKAIEDAFLRNNSQWDSSIVRDQEWLWNPPFDPSSLNTTPGQCNIGGPAAWNSSVDFSHWKWIDFQPEGLLRGRYNAYITGKDGSAANPFEYLSLAASDFDSNGICVSRLESHVCNQSGDWSLNIEATVGVDGSVTSEEEW